MSINNQLIETNTQTSSGIMSLVEAGTKLDWPAWLTHWTGEATLNWTTKATSAAFYIINSKSRQQWV